MVQTVPNNFTNTVVQTNEVIKEVPKEIEKIVKVPADIPEDYVTAMNIYAKITNAAIIKDPERGLAGHLAAAGPAVAGHNRAPRIISICI